MLLDLLAAGKDVVTANKALLAKHGAEVFDAARKHGRAIAFEASVAGGMPIIAALAQSLAANQILSLQGILNGTCNFILTGMSENGPSYAEALAEAQQRGYAEADPTLDVDGTDAAHKLAILAADRVRRRGAAVGHRAPRHRRHRRQPTSASPANSATRSSCSPRRGSTDDGLLALHVSPVLLRRHAPLALVRGAYNAISVHGDAVGDTLYYGRGAGQMPTASAVVADLIDLAVGRAQRTFQTLRLWSGNRRPHRRCGQPETVRSRFYLRLLVEDRPGVMAEVTRMLADIRSASRR